MNCEAMRELVKARCTDMMVDKDRALDNGTLEKLCELAMWAPNHTSMVEGRISAGVVVDDGSDIGGGASIMGTLSGGGKEVIRVGKRCILGANSGLGISLGDDCIIEAGLYVTGGTLVKLPDTTIVKARELSGANNLLVRRNSQTGAVEASQRTGSWCGLNHALHKNKLKLEI